MDTSIQRRVSLLFDPRLPRKFFHVTPPDNLDQIIEEFGKDTSTAESTIKALTYYSWNYQKCFFQEMLKIASYYYEKTRDKGTQYEKTQDKKTQDKKTQDKKTQDKKTQDKKTQDIKVLEGIVAFANW
jgi:hypothetical protein